MHRLGRVIRGQIRLNMKKPQLNAPVRAEMVSENPGDSGETTGNNQPGRACAAQSEDDMVNKVRVTIAGAPYAIATTDTENYITTLAKKLDDDITKLLDNISDASKAKLAADKVKAENETLKRENAALREQLAKLQQK